MMQHATDIASLIAQGVAEHRAGRLQQAAEWYLQVLSMQPEQADALHYLGLLMHQVGRHDASLGYLTRAVRAAPGNAEAWSNFGAVNLALNRPGEAETCFSNALALAPQSAAFHYALGTAILRQHRAGEAEAHLRRAVALSPADAQAHGNLGHALQMQGKLAEAVRVLTHALALDASLQPAWRTLAVAREQQGELAAAYEAYARSLALSPQDAQTHSALLLSLHFGDKVTPEALHAEALKFGARCAHAACVTPPARAKGGRLRVGYLSADLHNHPVAYFLEGVLAAHDASAFEVYVYASQTVRDETTTRLMRHAQVWRDIAPLTDADAAALIARDALDIVVDLGGHTGNNRLGVLAHRPAPVQATWLGYFDTTGMQQVDWLIADNTVLPAADERFYTERIARMPGYFLCFAPPAPAQDVAPLPALDNGYVTFGSFNKLAKLNDSVVALWAEVLRAVENSRLFLKAPALDCAETREALVRRFEACGVSRARLILEGRSPLDAMYRAYGRVDIALDPFPHNGGTTSVQALFSGVPVLTPRGDRYVARMGESMLGVLGMRDWVAEDAADYVRKAAAFAADVQALSGLRAGLRARVLASALCDAAGFTRALEAHYRMMCARE